MRVLTVPNWSFGRDPSLLSSFAAVLDAADVRVHYMRSDVDHNRTVSAFSGEVDLVTGTLLRLAERAFSRLDMCRHDGVHPFVGALDVCPFVLPPGMDDQFVVDFAAKLAHQYVIPVFLYEQSERGRHASALPDLRRGGFDALVDAELDPDFGPGRANARLGATVVGVRDFLIALNVNIEGDLAIAKRIAREIRALREAATPGFAGVRALGFWLASRSLAQVSVNLTQPDESSPDALVEYVASRAKVAETELIGVLREADLPRATRFSVDPAQVVG